MQKSGFRLLNIMIWVVGLSIGAFLTITVNGIISKAREAASDSVTIMQNIETPIIHWAMVIPYILALIGLAIAGYFIGRKLDAD